MNEQKLQVLTFKKYGGGNWNLQPLRNIMLFFCGPKGDLQTNLFVNAQNKKIYLNFLSGKSVKKEI